MLRGLLFSAATLLCCSSPVSAEKKAAGHMHHKEFDACAKACFNCAWYCEACATHCARMVADGKKDHAKSLASCRDCAEVCVAAGRIVGRYGPMANLVCDACAKACDICGAECEKFPDDKHMADCAKECRSCAKACRDMPKHAAAAK